VTGQTDPFAGVADISEFLAACLSTNLLVDGAKATFDNYYRNYHRNFSPRMRHYYADQIREIESITLSSPGLRLLEVGCGLGTESLWLASKGARVTAVDVRRDRIDVARAHQTVMQERYGRKLDVDFQNRSILDLEETETFDAIWMEQAFHHLEPRRDVIGKTAKLLRPGGYLAISEANALNPLVQAELLHRRGRPRVETMAGPAGKEIEYGIERITTAGSLTRAFAGAGIRRTGLRYFRMFPSSPAFDVLGGVERALTRPWLAPLLTHYNWTGRKG